MVTLNDVKQDTKIKTMVNAANGVLEAMGYTEHGPRHVGYVSRITQRILNALEYDERTCELGAIAGWVHDVGNLVNRKHHGQSGAILLFSELQQLGMPTEEVCRICSAVGNHEQSYGRPVSEISAALIIADKIDAHRTRVRKNKYNPHDIHDRVNYAISSTKLLVDKKDKNIAFSLEMDVTSSVLEFMQIYLGRMVFCEDAAEFLGCTFSLIINGMQINNFAHMVPQGSDAVEWVRDANSQAG